MYSFLAKNIDKTLNIDKRILEIIKYINKPLFDNTIKHAAVVQYDANGQVIELLMNPDKLKEMTIYEIKFILCHELMHIILQHGIILTNTNKKDLRLVLGVLEICVNDAVIQKCNFDINRLSFWNNLITTESVFKNKNILHNQSFEYYLHKTKQLDKNIIEREVII